MRHEPSDGSRAPAASPRPGSMAVRCSLAPDRALRHSTAPRWRLRIASSSLRPGGGFHDRRVVHFDESVGDEIAEWPQQSGYTVDGIDEFDANRQVFPGRARGADGVGTVMCPETG